MRPQLCEEALRLGRILASLAPTEPEAHGLVSLMELHASRAAARTTAAGEPVLLLEQNRRELGSFADPARACGLGTRGRAGRRARPLRAAGGDRCMSCPRADGSGDGLDADRRAVRRARIACALAGHRAQSRRRGGDGGRAQAGLDIVDRLAEEPALSAITSCPASAETSCSSSVGTARRALRSTMRQRSRPTAASATSCSSAPGKPWPRNDTAGASHLAIIGAIKSTADLINRPSAARRHCRQRPCAPR